MKALPFCEYILNDPLAEKIDDSTLKAVLKHRDHSTFLTIERKLESNFVITFCRITLGEILKEIENRYKKKFGYICIFYM